MDIIVTIASAYCSIRPGLKKGDPFVTDICTFRYFNGYIYYKLNFSDDWNEIPRRPKTYGVYEVLTPLYKAPIKITKRKFEDLQSLKKVIPEDYHHFYNNLPHECDDEEKFSGQCKHIITV